MKRTFFLTTLLALTGGSTAFAQTTPAGSLDPASGGGRPSNNGGAVLPSTQPAGAFGTYLGKPPPRMWLGIVKGRASPGSGVDRTTADFGGIAPNDPGGPATRPDAGIGNSGISRVRPDAGLGNPSTSQVRPDEQIGIARVPRRPAETRLTSRPVQRIRVYGPPVRRTTVFPGTTKLPGVVNPGWATRNGNAAARSTAVPAVAKGTIYAAGTGRNIAEPQPLTRRNRPGTAGSTRPVPQTGIVNPASRVLPRPFTTPGPGAGGGREKTRPAGSGTPGTGTLDTGGTPGR